MWIVSCKLPRFHSFRAGYFPRKVYYKKDALELAEEAKKAGATDIKVEKAKK